MSDRLPWHVHYIKRGHVRIDVDLARVDDGRCVEFLLRSDVHHDSNHQDRKMEMRHLEEALHRKAGIIDNGDLVDAMGGKWDRRNLGAADIIPALRTADYLTALPKYTANNYEKYSKNWAVWGVGNHETAMLQHHQVDITQAIVSQLNDRTGSKHQVHGYAGWVQFRLQDKTGSTPKTQIINMFRHHGYGFSAPVTRGTIQHARMMGLYPDAQIVMTGHDHNEWELWRQRHRIGPTGKVYTDEMVFIKVPGYKGPELSDGWAIEKGFDPKTNAGVWLKFYYSSPDGRYRFKTERAQ